MGPNHATASNPLSYPRPGIYRQVLENGKRKTRPASVFLPMHGHRLEKETDGSSLLYFRLRVYASRYARTYCSGRSAGVVY